MNGVALPRFSHWRIERDDRFLWAYADRAAERVNSLSPEMIEELDGILDLAEAPEVTGLGFASAKRSGFIAGFDIRALDDFSDAEKLGEALARANAIFDRLEGLRVPTVAAISGFCMGGGLELALACRYRVAKDIDSTRLGLPEVKLGLHPGFGGTARLSRIIGGLSAMQLTLTGRAVRARAALKLGLVDRVVDRHGEVRWAARSLLVKQPKGRTPSLISRVGDCAVVRKVAASFTRRQLKNRGLSPEQYPAPFAIVNLWENYGGSFSAMARAERISFTRLLGTPASEGLRRVFFLMELLKARSRGVVCACRRIHVVGAGVMGGDIAAWCALKGLEVTLQDRDQEAIDAACKRARSLFGKRLRTAEARAAAAARLIADPNGEGVARADIVIEAIAEDLDIKRSLFAALEPRMRKTAILATNTSALPLEDLAQPLGHPERLIGIHFFNPVAALPLVEVVCAASSDPAAVNQGVAFATLIEKQPLVVKSSPGFLVNRVLAPYLIEALKAEGDGISLEEIDRAAVGFGMPVGPVELADRIGLDVCVQVTSTLGKPGERSLVSGRLAPLVEAGCLGKKAGRGLYEWKEDKPVHRQTLKSNSAEATGPGPSPLALRLITPLLDECEAALADGVVASSDELDAGVIFGTGFPPFRGGPMHFRNALLKARS